MSKPLIRSAAIQDADTVSSILTEAAQWLVQKGAPMWQGDELAAKRIASDAGAGLFFLAELDGEAAGVVKFQLEDPEFWPDRPLGEAAYIHRLAVRRRFAGGGISTALMRWAVERTRSLGRPWLRLDCDASRPRLRAVYERFGFKHQDDRQVGPYLVARYEINAGRSTTV